LIAASITLVVVVLAFFWVVARRRTPQSTEHAIVYQVSGSATKASVIYLLPDGQHNGGVDVPWSSSFRVSSGMTLSLVASTTDGSPITCVTSEDGRTIATQSGANCSLQADS
jgi:hypothetical protein